MADVPVGGGVVLPDVGLVITQATAGELRGFTSVCTHRGCTISGVSTTIDCSCHGSKFALTDGSVVSGPATSPLAAAPVEVVGTAVTRG
ncbi:Rieske (2Fe-2S) protein [Nocardioides alcanivorans]|uniref:Rieske (2Fe-2S) protein n=1 Tax=Nocardioides alcanivorans TaxID=2897352 RepID=UPI001F2EF00A|nr:Rieske (2Fe-2S) protein [Nocardioides alcanivorans]